MRLSFKLNYINFGIKMSILLNGTILFDVMQLKRLDCISLGTSSNYDLIVGSELSCSIIRSDARDGITFRRILSSFCVLLQ